jgi:hypothetical protein
MDDARIGALFVDFENVYWGLVHAPVSLTRESALTATMDALSKLRRDLREKNTALVVERAYADFEELPDGAARTLQLSGLLPRYVHGRAGKSTADIEMSLDVQHYILTQQSLAEVVLVGGDRDYLPILHRLKEARRRVSVCALKSSLAGDVRAFVENYMGASIIELDQLVTLSSYKREGEVAVLRPAQPEAAIRSSTPTSAIAPRLSKPTATSSGNGDADLREAYLRAMFRFMKERGHKEVHLGPFNRWVREADLFPNESTWRLNKLPDELEQLGAIHIESRDTGQGYGFSVVRLEYNHPLVQKVNE